MRINLGWVLALVLIFLVTPAVANADSLTFNFTACPAGFTCPGTLGASETYTSGGLSVGATGYSGARMQTELFDKLAGGDESGLGLGGMSHGEIQPGNFIQLDFSQLASAGITTGFLTMGSVQPGEGFTVCDSSTAGSMSGGSCFSASLDGQPVAITWSSSDPFIDITASSGDVLVDAVSVADAPSASVPEPGTANLVVLGIPVLLLVAGRRRLLHVLG